METSSGANHEERPLSPPLRPSVLHTVAVDLNNYQRICNPGDKESEEKITFLPYCSFSGTSKNGATEDNNSDSSNHVHPQTTLVFTSLSEEILLGSVGSRSSFVNMMRQFSNKDCRALELSLDMITNTVQSTEEGKDLYSKTLPFIASLVTSPQGKILPPQLPILRKHRTRSLTLSQLQICTIIAHGFFCNHYLSSESADVPGINFNELFSDPDDNRRLTKAQKLRCYLHYFWRRSKSDVDLLVTYTRKYLRTLPDWAKCDLPLTDMSIHCERTIEDYNAELINNHDVLLVDFANKVIGGGVLSNGAVQEEILFCIFPELTAGRAFVEKLNAQESILVTGPTRYCSYKGYGSVGKNSFVYSGTFDDQTPVDTTSCRRRTRIVGIDALYVHSSAKQQQFHPRSVLRELNKALSGFVKTSICFGGSEDVSNGGGGSRRRCTIATGKWGCGAFNGDPMLKSIIQLMAASKAGRNIALFTFGDKLLGQRLQELLELFSDKSCLTTVGELFNLISQYYKLHCTSTTSTVRSVDLFTFLHNFGKAKSSTHTLSKEMSTECLPEKPTTVSSVSFYQKTGSSKTEISIDIDVDPFENDGFDDEELLKMSLSPPSATSTEKGNNLKKTEEAIEKSVNFSSSKNSKEDNTRDDSAIDDDTHAPPTNSSFQLLDFYK